MGRFERGLAKVERADLEHLAAEPDDPMVGLRELIAEHRAAQTPLERYICDKLHEHIAAALFEGEHGGALLAGIPTDDIGLDELLAMDGLA